MVFSFKIILKAVVSANELYSQTVHDNDMDKHYVKTNIKYAFDCVFVYLLLFVWC